MGLQEGLHWNRGQRVPSRNSSTITPTVALEDDPERQDQALLEA